MTTDQNTPETPSSRTEEASGTPPITKKQEKVTESYPHASGDTTVLGPEVFVSADEQTINWKGVNYVRQAAPVEHPPLKEYKDGEEVEITKNGAWIKGFVQGREKKMNLLYVHTERGPVSVGSTKMIRKLL